MKFNSLKALMAVGMVTSPAISTVSTMSNVVLAKEDSSASTISNNFFMSFIDSMTTPEGITYKDGVTVIKEKINSLDYGTEHRIILGDERVANLKEGDIFVLENIGDTGKAFKVVSVSPTKEGDYFEGAKYEIKYSDPELSEFVKSINISSESNTNMIARIKNSKEKFSSAAKAMKEAGFSSKFIELLQNDYEKAYDELFDGLDSVNSENQSEVDAFVKSVNSKITAAGYNTSVYNIISTIETLSGDEMVQKVKKISSSDVNSVNQVLDSFLEFYQSGAITDIQKAEAYDTFVKSLTEVCKEIANKQPDNSGNNQESTQTPGTSQGESTNKTEESKKDENTATIQTGDFEKDFTLLSAPTVFDSTTLKTHSVSGQEDTAKNHEYQYYEVTLKGEDGQEVKMMALANNDNVDVLKNAAVGDTMTVNYTVSKCSDGSYDYVINKMSKKDAAATADATKTGENANTGIQNNGIYYAVGLGVAAVGIGALVYTKKKKEEK